MSVLHFAYASDGGAGRAARRTSAACRAAGLNSSFVFVSGPRSDDLDICLSCAAKEASARDAAIAEAMKDIQWDHIPKNRTKVSNTLYSIAYPALDVARHAVFAAADILHVHWPTWGVSPSSIGRWLKAGKTVFWTLHDCWPMTGGCHYPAGCEQFLTYCMKCPQIIDDRGFTANSFAEKFDAYGEPGSLTIICPTHWMARVASASAIFGRRRIQVIRNPIDLAIFAPKPDREVLRLAFGIGPDDLVLFFGSFDLAERRKGVQYLSEAVCKLACDGRLAHALPRGARVFLASMGRSSHDAMPDGVLPLEFGNVQDDAVLTDALSLADLVCVPSLEDNYPNMVVEAMACGTPCLVTPVGGIGEMIEEGVTGVVVAKPASVTAIEEGLLRFARLYFRNADMRVACRLAAETSNDPIIVGKQLRELYESVLGRPLRIVPEELHRRMTRTFSLGSAASDIDTGPEFLRFPANLALLERMKTPEAFGSTTTPGTTITPPDRHRIVSVRTFHVHHSAQSGPYQFLRHLDRREWHATHLAVPMGSTLAGREGERYRMAGQLMGTPAFGQQGNAWLAEAELLLQCASEAVDLVHFIDGELGGWLMPLIPPEVFYGGRRPIIVSTFHQPPAILKNLIDTDRLTKHDAVVALCSTQKAYLETWLDPAQVHMIPHGIDTVFFHPNTSSRVRPQDGVFRILLVGHWLRDLDATFATLQSVRMSGLNVKLEIIGPNLSNALDDAAVRIRSGLSDEELREAYWDADVVFIPLVDATANNAVLEAMACGRPVISTDVGGVGEAVSATSGILCPAGDVAGLSRAVLQVAADPELRSRMGRAGRARAENFAWPIIAERHRDLYRRLIDARCVLPEIGSAQVQPHLVPAREISANLIR